MQTTTKKSSRREVYPSPSHSKYATGSLLTHSRDTMEQHPIGFVPIESHGSSTDHPSAGLGPFEEGARLGQAPRGFLFVPPGPVVRLPSSACPTATTGFRPRYAPRLGHDTPVAIPAPKKSAVGSDVQFYAFQ